MSELTLCDLRDDELQLIASHLCLESLCNLGRVSKRFAFVNSDDQLWRRLYLTDFGSGDVPSQPEDGWQQAYRERCWEEVLAQADDDNARWELEAQLEYQLADEIGNDGWPEGYDSGHDYGEDCGDGAWWSD